jgi:hypothetical protein
MPSLKLESLYNTLQREATIKTEIENLKAEQT